MLKTKDTTNLVKRFFFPASMGMTIKKADGTRIELGTVTNRPIIGAIENYLVNRKIKAYRKAQGVN